MRKIETAEKRNSAEFAAVCEEILRQGHHVSFRANGESMRPNVSDGDTVVITPAAVADVERGDVVLTHDEARLKLHRVVAFHSSSAKLTTRGDSGQENDSATANVLGKLIAIRSAGKEIPVTGATAYLHTLRTIWHRLKLAAARRVSSNASRWLVCLALAGIGLLFTAIPAAAQNADLAVTADTASPTPQVSPGGQITYTVTVVNNGASTANTPAVTMNTPSSGAFNTTFVSAARTGGTGTWVLTSPGVGNSGLITLTRNANMANASTATFTIVVQVPANVTNGTVFANSVNISSTTPDSTPGNNTATVSVTVATPDISMTQSAAPATVPPGGNITYSETVTNNSATLQSFGASLTQNTPANTTFVSVTPPAGWTCGTVPAVGGTGAITCTANAALSVSSTTGNFSIVVNVASGLANGSTITNSATVSESGTDPTPANNTTSTSVTVQAPDISMTQGAAPNPVATGGNITYTETVTNNSATLQSFGALLTQNTPANTTFVSATPPAGWTCGTVPAVGGIGAITCTANAALAVSSTTGNFSIVVLVNAAAPVGSTITNTATVSESGTDPTPANNTTTTSVTVSGADLSMTQVASVTAVATGGTITYTETVTNNGPNTAVGVTLYQQTPPNTTFASITPPAAWTCGTTPAVGATGQVICTANADVTSGTASGNFAYVVTVSGGTAAGTSILNWADVTSQTTDPTSSNNATTTSVLVEVAADADLSLAATASPTPVFIASPITYTIQLQNLGLNSAATVVVTDTYPTGLVNPSATSTQGTCAAPSGGTIVCTIGPVAYPQLTPITITLTGTTPNSATTLTNTAVVTSGTTDPVAANNTSIVITVVQPLVCATPGKDGVPTNPLPQYVNTYYQGVGTAGVGTTSITVATPSSGSATQISVGDLLLVMQMQGAQINTANTLGTYGDGVPGDPASGSTSLGNSGYFEFVAVTVVTPGTGTLVLTVVGTGGANSGLLNSYATAPATNTGTPQGAQTFQVIRVPQYSSVTLTSSVQAFPWNGSVGGVLALDIASQLTLSGTVSLDGAGFRGGGGMILAGGAGTATDVVTLSTVTTNASKGEGIAGTPHYVAPAQSSITLATTAQSTAQTYLEGYPNGSFARGAPANAGGGATDANPAANDQNSGGGAGGNGGTGGAGGFGWNTAGLVGGFGGVAFPASTSAVIMGGAAGAGTTNNGTSWDPVNNTGPANNCGANCTGIYSSGAAGGGIVIIHAGSVIGTGTITANGQSALSVENDGGGGGGAGGTILVQANTGSLSGLTLSTAGGNGGNTWPEQAPGTFPGNRHGPGGGGGGGVIFTSSNPASESVAGGIPGTTTLANDAYGATVGQAGMTATVVAITQTPGTQSGAYCAGADLAVTNSGSPNPVLVGGTITYTQTVSNAGPLDALNAVFSEAVPANTTFSSIIAPAGWTCNSNASILSSGLISCTNPDVPSGVSGNGTFTVNVTVNAGTVFGTQIVDVASLSAGTNDPNLTNNSATATNVVGSASSMLLTLTKTPTSNTVPAGNNITWNMVITNNGPGTSTAGVYDSVPTNTTFVSMTAPAGWGCSLPAVGAVAGTNLSCTTPSLANGASATVTLVVNVIAGTPNGTFISNTANANGGLPNPNPNGASATSNVLVAAATQADLSVTSSASPNPVLVGGSITYAQTVTNNGPATANSLTFTDAIPSGTTFVSLATPPGWSCSTPAVGSGGTVTCTIASLASGGTASFPLVVKLASATTAGTTITNSPTIAATTSDPNGANNTATATDIVASPSQADVTLTKTASPEPVDVNSNLTYSIQVTNHGPESATGVSVSDPMPAQVTFTSAATSQGSCTTPALNSVGGTVSCTIGTVSVGGSVLITINVTAAIFSSTAVTCNGAQVNSCNTATLTTTSSNPKGATVTSSAGTTIQASTAVQLTSFQAISRSEGGVLLEWHTREEIRNLGFNIYREDPQGRHKVNPSLIAGGALFIRGGRPQHSAKTYQWVDAAGSATASYWLEDVDLSGMRTLHGPARAEAASATSAAANNSITHSENATLLTKLNDSVAAFTSKIAARPMMPKPIFPIPGPRVYRAPLEGIPAVKISVANEGWYHVSGAQLIAAGLNPDDNIQDLQLYAEGIEQPLLVRGAETGQLRNLSSIEFYGTGIDTPYSGERVYWLVQNTRPGTRISSVPAAASGSSAQGSFGFATIHEDRTTYFATLLNGEDNDNFFGNVVTSQPVDENLNASNSDPASGIPITLDVTLQGGTDQQQHRVSVQFNGASIGELDFYGLANVTNTFPIDPSLLQDGAATVTLRALEGDNDVSLVQSTVLHYPHRYVADSNWLRATAPASSSLHIAGFTRPQIRVVDITNPQEIVELKGTVALEGAAYGVTLTTSNPGPAERTLLAFTEDQVAAPDALTFHHPSALAHNPRSTDIVMITHPHFATNLAPLARLHESEGRSVTVVSVDAIFDAFNYGERSPYAIRNYLKSLATSSTRKPQAVLLVGDASLDPRNYLGFGNFDFVPTRIIETQAFKTASDDWFTDFQQTGFATIPIGRLPVRTAADADLVISKIVGYENGSSAGSWNQQALIISDQNEGANFTAESQYAISNLPSSLKPAQIVADGLDPAAARQQIIAGLNHGALLVNYSGHGATEQWSFADLFNNNDAATLSNGQRLPFYLLMDCLNGFFHDVYSQSLAESLLLAPNGGAVAVWASSGFTTSPPQASMNQAMLHALQMSPSLTIGAAALQSKLSVNDKDVRRTWILFGDPAMKLQLAPHPHGRTAPTQSDPPLNSGAEPRTSCPRCPIQSEPVE